MSQNQDATHPPDDEAGRAEAIRALPVMLSDHFERGFIVIGGWAVHDGAKNYSLDGNAMISYEVQGTLRDSYDVTKTPQKHREQFRTLDTMTATIIWPRRPRYASTWSRPRYASAGITPNPGLRLTLPLSRLVR